MGWTGLCAAASVGEELDLVTIAEVQAELNARGLTLARMDALFRLADGGSGVHANLVSTELDNRLVTTNRMNAVSRNADGSSGIVTTDNGTYSHPNDTNENEVLVIAASKYEAKVALDLNTLTQTATIRTYEQVDGATYRLVDTAIFPTDFPANIKAIITEFAGDNRQKRITMQSSVAEGAIRSIPYARKTV